MKKQADVADKLLEVTLTLMHDRKRWCIMIGLWGYLKEKHGLLEVQFEEFWPLPQEISLRSAIGILLCDLIKSGLTRW